jgi:hypothetical protein
MFPSSALIRHTDPVLYELHDSWSWFVIFANAVAGLWALSAHRWTPLRTRALWWFIVIAELTVFVQVGLGVGMVAGQGIAVPKFHMFYGFVAIIAVGLIYSYRQQMEKHKYLLYGFGSLFIMGLGIRAMLVATRV